MNKKIREELRNSKAVEEFSQQFSVMGDPNRMRICYLLHTHPELPVGEIADILNMSDSAVSHSIKKLRNNNFVETRRDHKFVYYKLSDTSFIKGLRKNFSNLKLSGIALVSFEIPFDLLGQVLYLGMAL